MIYQCLPQIAWSVERDGILLINRNTGKVRFLPYPQASIWDLISRGYAFDRTVRMVSAIAAMKHHDGEEFILKSLKEWSREGFLTEKKQSE